MGREQEILEVEKLAKNLKRPILIDKYKRRPIEGEVVDAYKTPVPTGVQLSNGKNVQVNRGDWVVIHENGTKSTYDEVEFKLTYERTNK